MFFVCNLSFRLIGGKKMKYIEPRYEGNMVKLVSTEVVKDLDTVIRLLSVCDSYKDEDKDYCGKNLTFVSDKGMSLGMYPRASIPLNHGTGYALNVLRTFPVSPGMRFDHNAVIRDYPHSGMHKNPQGIVSVGDIRTYLVDTGKDQLKLCEFGYITVAEEDSPMRMDIKDLLGQFNDADVVFAYARDNNFLNTILRNAGMRAARGNVGPTPLEDKVFVWYKTP